MAFSAFFQNFDLNPPEAWWIYFKILAMQKSWSKPENHQNWGLVENAQMQGFRNREPGPKGWD
jgi:hypothetical protein